MKCCPIHTLVLMDASQKRYKFRAHYYTTTLLLLLLLLVVVPEAFGRSRSGTGSLDSTVS